MDAVLNPYAPGAGRRPPALAGREPDIERFDVLCARLEAGAGARGMVLTGLRGVGKTVLLNEFRDRAQRRHWIVAKIEAGGARPFRVLLAQALNQALRTAGGHEGAERIHRLLAVFKAFTLKIAPDGSLAFGIEVEAARGHADTGDLEVDITELALELGEAARDLSVGVLILVDEMQDLDATELAALCSASHEAAQRDVPFVVVGAGLPNLPVALTEAKSYAERLFEYRRVGPLGPDDSHLALTRPASEREVKWLPEAADAVLGEARGYPYFIQVYGDATWNYAPASPISAHDAATGIAAGLIELDEGFYGSRWERATPSQKRYLRALAQGGDDPSATAEVARRSGRRPGDVSVARDQLIRKGLLYAPDRGTIAFTVPGMAAFIARQPE